MTENVAAPNVVDTTIATTGALVSSLAPNPVVKFEDDARASKTNYRGHAMREDARDGELSLDNFIKRPIWVEGIRLSTTDTALTTLSTFDPWLTWASSPVIKPKITNYSRFRGGLRLRLVVNGVRQAYGRYGVAYLPLPSQLGMTPPAYTVPRLMQLPHVVIDPSTNATLELDLPYLFHKPWAEILGLIGSPEQSASATLGYIFVFCIAELQFSSTTTTTQCQVSAFLYPGDDFEIDLPTYAVTQGDETEHDPDGPVSGMLHKFGAFVGSVNRVVDLGPFGKATVLAAKFGANVANALGFSKPPSADEATYMLQRNYGSMAVGCGVNPVHRFVADPTSEIVVSSSPVGATSHDELSVAGLAKRPGLVQALNWLPSMDTGTLVGCWPVSPNHTGIFDEATNHAVPAPISIPAGYATFWRGTLRYKVEVVANSFMSGRLYICYIPPSVSQNVPAAGSQELYSTLYSCVLDLAADSVIDFEVAWKNCSPFAKTSRTWAMSPLDPLLATSEFTNGAVAIYVLNELISPASTATATVLVRLSGGDDFEVFVPSEGLLTAAPVIQGEEISDTPTVCHLNGPSQVARYGDMSFGESIQSLRMLLKRPAYAGIWSYENFGSDSPSDGLTALHNNVCHPAYVYLDYCFLFRRGGFTYYVLPGISTASGGGQISEDMPWVISRTPLVNQTNWSGTTGPPGPAGVAVTTPNYGGCGHQFTYPKHGGLTAEVPSYMRNLGLYNMRPEMDGDPFGFMRAINAHAFTGVVMGPVGFFPATSLSQQAVTSIACNDDFSYGVFLGVPLSVSAHDPAGSNVVFS